MSILDRFLAEKRANAPIEKRDVTSNRSAMKRIASLPTEVKSQWVKDYLAVYNTAVATKGKDVAHELASRLAWCKVPQQYKSAAVISEDLCPKCGKAKDKAQAICSCCLSKEFPDKG